MTLRLAAILALAIIILGGVGTYFAVSTVQKLNDLSRKVQMAEQQNGDIALETRCSDAAAKYYQGQVAEESTPEIKQLNRGTIITHAQENHWNRRLKKCFVEIITDTSNNGFETLDVVDALEGKRYAEFNGHAFCNTLVGGQDQCAMDSADVWLDGDDQKSKSDNELGFRGLLSGKMGSADTREQFLKQIKRFMND